MGLNNRLKRVKAIGEDKKITLRIPEGKASILEKLAKYYGTNTSSLIREMIDNSIMELQKEFIVINETEGLVVVKYQSDSIEEEDLKNKISK